MSDDVTMDPPGREITMEQVRSNELVPRGHREFMLPDERATLEIERISNELFRVTTIQDAKKVCGMAEAVAALTRQINASERIRRDSLVLIQRTERKLGEITMQLPRSNTAVTRYGVTPDILHAVREDVCPVREAARKYGLTRETIRQYRALSPGAALTKAAALATPKSEVLAQNGLSRGRVQTAEVLAKASDAEFEAAVAAQERPSISQTANILQPRKSRHAGYGFAKLARESVAFICALHREKRTPTDDDVREYRRRLATLEGRVQRHNGHV